MPTDSDVLTIVWGDRSEITLTDIKDTDGSDVDLSTGTLVFTAMAREDSTEAVFVKTPDDETDPIEYSEDETNAATVFINANDLSELPNAHQYLYAESRFWRDGDASTPQRFILRVVPGLGTDPDAS